MKRRQIVVLLALVAATLTLPTTHVVGRSRCAISNFRTAATYVSLPKAVNAASQRDTLIIKGTCTGSTIVGKSLTLKGVNSSSLGRARLDGGRLSSLPTGSPVARIPTGLTTWESLGFHGDVDMGVAERPVLFIRSGSAVMISGLVIAHGSSSFGGGIHNEGALIIATTTITENDASRGGGIHNEGRLTIADSSVTGNSASSYGGGIINYGSLTVTRSIVSRNTAIDQGGGIANFGGSLTLKNSNIHHNTSGQGGGMYTDGTATVTDSKVDHNTGSGIWVETTFDDSSPLATLKLLRSSVRHNIAEAQGGGIANFGVVTITDSTVSQNTARGGGGGGIDNATEGVLTVAGSTIAHNSAASSGGGGIANEGLATIAKSHVDNNIAGFGGGIFNWGEGSLTLSESTVRSNSGGGIENDGGTVTAIGNVIENNDPNDCVDTVSDCTVLLGTD